MPHLGRHSTAVGGGVPGKSTTTDGDEGGESTRDENDVHARVCADSPPLSLSLSPPLSVSFRLSLSGIGINLVSYLSIYQ